MRMNTKWFFVFLISEIYLTACAPSLRLTLPKLSSSTTVKGKINWDVCWFNPAGFIINNELWSCGHGTIDCGSIKICNPQSNICSYNNLKVFACNEGKHELNIE